MLLQITDLHKSFETSEGPLNILRGVSFELEMGQSLALTGESGCGKSTLLHLIGGLDSLDAGSLKVEGQELAGLSDAQRAALRRSSIAVVFQQFNLIPSLNVADNIQFQARLAMRYDKQWMAEIVTRLDLGDQLMKYPEQLSGGQQQRVAIARALVVKPALILADEPTGNLDPNNANIVLDLFLELVSTTSTSLLMVTHSNQIADRLNEKLKLVDGRVHR